MNSESKYVVDIKSINGTEPFNTRPQLKEELINALEDYDFPQGTEVIWVEVR